MTAIIDGVMVTGTPEEISNLIKIYRSRISYGTTTGPTFQTTGGENK